VNIIYVDAENKVSDDYMYQYYGDLLRELATNENVNIWLVQGIPKHIDDLLNIAGDAPIDLIVFGLGYFAIPVSAAFGKIEGLAETDIPVFCLIHKPQNLLEEKLNFCKINNVDLLLESQEHNYKRYGEIAGVPSQRSFFTATPKLFHPREVEKIYDIGFSGALHGIEADGSNKIEGPTSNLRERVGNIINNNEKYNVFWNSSNTLEYRINTLEDYATKINECKIWLSTTGPLLDIGPRYFEAALSKTLILCNNMPEQYGDFFIDGETCVTFENDLSNFEEKLDFYLSNDSERSRIINNAYNLVSQNYTWKHMADNILNKAREIKCRSNP
tara:strand:+ start:1542 stop:2531 length:990 start_codon:yes stop_codon:yes gene_type:complete